MYCIYKHCRKYVCQSFCGINIIFPLRGIARRHRNAGHPSTFSALFLLCFYHISLFWVCGLIMNSYRLSSTLVTFEWFLRKLLPLDLENFREFKVFRTFLCNALPTDCICMQYYYEKLQIKFKFGYPWMIFTEVTALRQIISVNLQFSTFCNVFTNWYYLLYVVFLWEVTS